MNKKNIIISITLAIIISAISVYATTTYIGGGNILTYNNTNSGLNSTNVQDALDELYKVQQTGCPIGYTCEETAAGTIVNLYNNGTKTSVTTAGDEEITQVTSEGLMQDSFGNIRYYGADPNNYVTFNGETAGWRIISIGTVYADENDTEGETRIKLIRNTSIGNYSWDSSASTVNSGYGVNDWTQADLKTELNGLYYNSQSGTCYNGSKNASTTCNFTSTGLTASGREMIDDALWYLGGWSTAEIYANAMYGYERGTTVYSGSGHPTKWTRTVALM